MLSEKESAAKVADADVAMLVDTGSDGVRRFELRRGCIASRLRLARLCEAISTAETGKEPADAPEACAESGSDMAV